MARTVGCNYGGTQRTCASRSISFRSWLTLRATSGGKSARHSGHCGLRCWRYTMQCTQPLWPQGSVVGPPYVPRPSVLQGGGKRDGGELVPNAMPAASTPPQALTARQPASSPQRALGEAAVPARERDGAGADCGIGCGSSSGRRRRRRRGSTTPAAGSRPPQHGRALNLEACTGCLPHVRRPGGPKLGTRASRARPTRSFGCLKRPGSSRSPGCVAGCQLRRSGRRAALPEWARAAHVSGPAVPAPPRRDRRTA